MRLFLCAILSVGGAGCAGGGRHAQSLELPGLPAAGQSAVIFAPGIVSTGDVFSSTFTPDGRSVVFTKFAPPRMILMSSTWVDGSWSAPVVLPFSGTFRDLDPSFSPDGRRLFFSSWRPTGPTAADTMNAADTWYVEREGSAWSAPVHVAGDVNGEDQDYYPSITRRGVLYFDSFRSRPRRRLVYRAESLPGGGFGSPKPLDAVINADSGASNLFVDADERYVVFAAIRPEGRGGVDLYISWRNGESWTPPRNLGDLVNTSATEFCPFVSRDGRYLYFTRASTVEGRATRNVYVVRFDAIARGDN